MEYTVQKLAQLAGVSARTLRYYDTIGLLKPARTSASGYRVYGQAEVDKLQQILFYKELGVCLADIRDIVTAPSFDALRALREHRDKLVAKRKQLDLLIINVNQSITSIERKINMRDQDKFAGFKQKMIEENERKYGEEIRAKYGDEQVDEANKKFMAMNEEQYAGAEKLSAVVMETLHAAMATGDPAGELAQKTADLHRRWLSCYWPQYTPEAHAGLARMYVEDERFTAYYEQKQPGAAVFLRDAILIYTGLGEKKEEQ